MEWMLMPFRRYAEFSGRSRRKEFWMFQLLNLIVVGLLYAVILGGGGLRLLTAGMSVDAETGAVDPQLLEGGPGALFWIGFAVLCLWALATIIPSLAVTVRRLHDRNMSGWYFLGFIVAVIILSMIPLIGPLIVLALEIGWIVLLALPGTAGPNKYGPDPLDPSQAQVFA